jgi:predicted nuclease of predicted toxin-antitoxin system
MPHEADRPGSGAAGLGSHDASDDAILDYAARELRVVVTLDRDFPQILAFTRAVKPSIVLIRQQRLRAADVAALLSWSGKITRKAWIADVWRKLEHAERECAYCH